MDIAFSKFLPYYFSTFFPVDIMSPLSLPPLYGIIPIDTNFNKKPIEKHIKKQYNEIKEQIT